MLFFSELPFGLGASVLNLSAETVWTFAEAWRSARDALPGSPVLAEMERQQVGASACTCFSWRGAKWACKKADRRVASVCVIIPQRACLVVNPTAIRPWLVARRFFKFAVVNFSTARTLTCLLFHALMCTDGWAATYVGVVTTFAFELP